MTQPDPILQVLLFRDAGQSYELGPSLWAAFQEVEQFYNRGRRPRPYHRFYLAEAVPDGVRDALPADWKDRGTAVGDETFWAKVRGRYQRTYDQEKLGEEVRRLLIKQALEQARHHSDLRERLEADQSHGSENPSPLDYLRCAPLLLVTDQEITPPPDWRYVLWDSCRNGVVVSIAPIDPHYWSERGEYRVQTIKHRVRVACCAALSEMLGLERCDNPTCLLYASVDSVISLDQMILLGPEHNIPALADHGFDARPSDPAQVQPIITPVFAP